MELAYGRGAAIPDGTAAVVVVLLIFRLVVGIVGWGLLKPYGRGR
ncbi:hypothetical protein [Streptomyces sp. NPDC049040]